MAKPGRKPKPTQLKKLAGNPGRRPLNQAEPDFAGNGKKPRKPIGLPYYASRLWDQISDPLYKNGLLTVVDVPVLQSLCLAYHWMIEANKDLKKRGILVVDVNGDIRKNPAEMVARQQSSLLVKAAAEFGITPSSRSRITAIPEESEASLADLLFSMVE